MESLEDKIHKISKELESEFKTNPEKNKIIGYVLGILNRESKQLTPPPTGKSESEIKAIQLTHDLAEWSEKYPRNRIYAMGSKSEMDNQLIQMEERAKEISKELILNPQQKEPIGKTESIIITLKNNEGKTIDIFTNLREILDNDIDYFYDKLEKQHHKNCTNESVNHCECTPQFEDYIFSEIKFAQQKEPSGKSAEEIVNNFEQMRNIGLAAMWKVFFTNEQKKYLINAIHEFAQQKEPVKQPLNKIELLNQYCKEKNIERTSDVNWSVFSDWLVDNFVQQKELKPLTEWVSVKDGLPERGVAVNVLLTNGLVTTAYLKKNEKAWQLFGDIEKICELKNESVIEWIPLPNKSS